MKIATVSCARHLSKIGAFGLLAGVALFAATTTAKAQVQVTGFYSQVGMNFSYTFDVVNTSGVDVSFVNALFPTQQGSLAISNVVTSGDYLFDYNSGSLAFIEGSTPFLANSTVSGFSLTSNAILTPDSLEASDINGNTVTATFVPVVVPEAGTLSLLTLALTATAGVALSRRRAA